MHFNRDTGVCTTNYTNDQYILITDDPDTSANTDEYWFIRMKNPYDNMMYSSEEGLIEVNKYPPSEYRIWICVKCYNDFQFVTTKPFMIDMQCGSSSTTITIPQEIDTTYYYNTRTQTWEATNEQGSIYFEFEAWTSTTGACPIIEYKVDVTSIVATNENVKTPNSKYGMDSTDFVYQSGYACTPSTADATDCRARQQPTFANNTDGVFTRKTGSGLDAYSPDDI